MVNMYGNPSTFTDCDRLSNCFQDRMAFVSHVREVHATVLSRDSRKFNEFICVSIHSGGIYQGRRGSDGTIFHRLTDQRLHLLELSSCRLNVSLSEYHTPDLG